MPTWTRIANGLEALIIPISTDPILPGDTSALLTVSIFYRFNGMPQDTVVNYSYNGAFVGSGTISAPSSATEKRIVHVAGLNATVPINPSSNNAATFTIVLDTDVAGAAGIQYTEVVKIDPAPEYKYPPIKNASIARNGEIYSINWQNDYPPITTSQSKATYAEILVEEQELYGDSSEGPYMEVAKLPGTATMYALGIPPNKTLRNFRITPRDSNPRNRAVATYVTVRRVPSTPRNVKAEIVRNGIKLSWEIDEVGARYHAINIHTAAGMQTINVFTSARSYTFTSLPIGTEHWFSVAQRDDMTMLYSETSKLSNAVRLYGTFAQNKRGVDYRFGNFQPARIYAGEKLIWIR